MGNSLKLLLRGLASFLPCWDRGSWSFCALHVRAAEMRLLIFPVGPYPLPDP